MYKVLVYCLEEKLLLLVIRQHGRIYVYKLQLLKMIVVISFQMCSVRFYNASFQVFVFISWAKYSTIFLQYDGQSRYTYMAWQMSSKECPVKRHSPSIQLFTIFWRSFCYPGPGPVDYVYSGEDSACPVAL